MTTTMMTKLDWKTRKARLDKACAAGEEIAAGKPTPINPLAIARAEGRKRLRCLGKNFGDRFDGLLRFHPSKGCFTLLYNNIYDQGGEEGNHPRTRFSVAHELGHYYLDHHRAALLAGKQVHASQGEFTTDSVVEREADAFASGLLVPSQLARPLINESEPDLQIIDCVGETFSVSRVCAALRCIQLSDFLCAAIGICDGCIAWSAASERMIETGFYPPERKPPASASAQMQWTAFKSTGRTDGSSGAAFAREWFRSFDRDELDNLHVDEHYIPVRSMGTLIVLLSIPEDQFDEDEND